MPPLVQNPIQQLVSSYVKSGASKLILIQSSNGYPQRQQAVSSYCSAVYERAGVRTPATNAARDWNGAVLWLRYMVQSLSKQQSKKTILWIQTTNSQSTGMLPACVEIVQLSADPLNWDLNVDETENIVSMENLESFTSKVESCAAPATVVLESLIPLIMRHGFKRVLQCLKRWMSNNKVLLVVPINSSLLAPRQLVALQDACHASLLLQNGEATLLRQGGRDSSNVLRQEVPFELETDAKSGTVSLVVGPSDKNLNKEEMAAPIEPAVVEKVSSVPPSTTPAGKIVLQHQEDDQHKRPSLSAHPKQPQIYMQENDPEFDDFDEEDPDDDLDI